MEQFLTIYSSNSNDVSFNVKYWLVSRVLISCPTRSGRVSPQRCNYSIFANNNKFKQWNQTWNQTKKHPLFCLIFTIWYVLKSGVTRMLGIQLLGIQLSTQKEYIVGKEVERNAELCLTRSFSETIKSPTQLHYVCKCCRISIGNSAQNKLSGGK